MSPSPNGNDSVSRVFVMSEATHVGEARRAAVGLLSKSAFDETRLGAIAIVINELGNNLVRYGQEGRLIMRYTSGVFEILALDRGPGLDVDLVMHDGYSTGETPGTGLGAVSRLADQFDMHSLMGKGTAVVARFLVDGHPSAYEIAAINIPFPGETTSGDAWIVRAERDSRLNMMVVDGLGHGPLAAGAAGEALTVFRQAPDVGTPERVLQAVHARLKTTRGGAVFCFALDKDQIRYVGVGNVRAVLVRVGLTRGLISSNGTAGLQMRTVTPRFESWGEARILVVHSDGLNTRWNLDDYPGLLRKDPALIAGVLYRDHSRGNDDATVVVVRRNS